MDGKGRPLDRRFSNLQTATRSWGTGRLSLSTEIAPTLDAERYDPAPRFMVGWQHLPTKPAAGTYGVAALLIPRGVVEISIHQSAQSQRFAILGSLADFVWDRPLAEYSGVMSLRPGTQPKVTLYQGTTTSAPSLRWPWLLGTGTLLTLPPVDGGPVWAVLQDVSAAVNALYSLFWRELIDGE